MFMLFMFRANKERFINTMASIVANFAIVCQVYRIRMFTEY